MIPNILAFRLIRLPAPVAPTVPGEGGVTAPILSIGITKIDKASPVLFLG